MKLPNNFNFKSTLNANVVFHAIREESGYKVFTNEYETFIELKDFHEKLIKGFFIIIPNAIFPTHRYFVFKGLFSNAMKLLHEVEFFDNFKEASVKKEDLYREHYFDDDCVVWVGYVLENGTLLKLC